jgi:hypothetical protein
MKSKLLSFLLALFVVSSGLSNAQVGGLLKRGLNKAMNKTDTTSAAATDQSQSRGFGGLLGGKTDIPHNEEYSFTGRIHMEMETYDKKDVTKSDYFTYFNANTLSAGIELRVTDPEKGETTAPTVFIFDMDNRCFLMLIQSEDSKSGIISTIPDDSTMAARSDTRKTSVEKPATITKTGNTKMIAGYRCDEYKVVEEGEDGYSNVWMTKDVSIKADKRNWGKTGMPTYYNYPGFEGSMMLAMEGYDKDNKLEMKMETKEINENFTHSISTAGYAFIKMNFMQAGKK